MTYYLVKIIVTTILIVVISEIAKRSSFLGGLLASIPLISVLAIIWLYIDTRDTEKVSALATSVFWLVIPSLALFVSLPLFLKLGLNFYVGIALSVALTIACYWLMVSVLDYFSIRL